MKHKKWLLIFILLFIHSIYFSFAQYGFEKKYGSFGYEEGHSIVITNDENFVVFGYTTSTTNGDADGFILKIAQNGDSLWMKMYGTSKEEVVKYGIETDNNGFILCGYIDVDSVNRNILIIKTDSNGNEQWVKNYGGASEDFAYCIQATIDSSYILSGKTKNISNGNHDMFSFKINMNGDSIWFKTYGDSLNDIARHIEITNDSSYVMIGSSQNILTNKYDVQLLKLNFFGDTIWTKRFHQRIDCFGYSAEQTNDKGYILCGFHEDSLEYPIQNIFVIKTDSTGNEQWRDTAYWGFDYEGSMLHSIKQTSDSGYIAIGSDHLEIICKNSMSQSQNLYIVKFSSSGNIVWENHYTQNNGLMEMGMDVAIVNDSTYIFCGYAETDMMAPNTGNIYVIKTNKFGSSWNFIQEYPKGNYALSVYPNPANGFINILLKNENVFENISAKIYDAVGKMVYQEKFLNAFSNQVIYLNLEKLKLPMGVYMLTIEDNKHNKGIAKVVVTNQ